MSLSKIQRRKKRQAKLLLRQHQWAELKTFLWEQFLGIQRPTGYRPEKDPSITNHRRVVGQRIASGRINFNETKRKQSEGGTV